MHDVATWRRLDDLLFFINFWKGKLKWDVSVRGHLQRAEIMQNDGSGSGSCERKRSDSVLKKLKEILINSICIGYFLN